MVWVTRDGRYYLVAQMETSHIVNCIKKIRRSPTGWRRQYLDRLKHELASRRVARQEAHTPRAARKGAQYRSV